LFIDRLPAGLEIYHEIVWSIWMTIFLSSAYVARRILNGMVESRKQVLDQRWISTLTLLFVSAYIIAVIMLGYDTLGPSTSIFSVSYGRNASILHYSLIFVLGIPILFHLILTSVRILSQIFKIQTEIKSAANEREFLESVRSTRSSIISLDKLFMILVMLVALFFAATVLKAPLKSDVFTYVLIVSAFMPIMIASFVVLWIVKQRILRSFYGALSGMLTPAAFDTMESQRIVFMLTIISNDRSPFFVPNSSWAAGLATLGAIIIQYLLPLFGALMVR